MSWQSWVGLVGGVLSVAVSGWTVAFTLRRRHIHVWLRPTFPGGQWFCSCGARRDDPPTTP